MLIRTMIVNDDDGDAYGDTGDNKDGLVWTALQQNKKEEGGERSGKEGGGQIIRWLYIYKVHLQCI